MRILHNTNIPIIILHHLQNYIPNLSSFNNHLSNPSNFHLYLSTLYYQFSFYLNQFLFILITTNFTNLYTYHIIPHYQLSYLPNSFIMKLNLSFSIHKHFTNTLLQNLQNITHFQFYFQKNS